MEVEREMTFRGKYIEDIPNALERAKRFITKKPEKNYWRFTYVSLTDKDGVDHHISEGTYDVTSMDSLFDKAEKMASGIKSLDRYYISVSIKRK